MNVNSTDPLMPYSSNHYTSLDSLQNDSKRPNILNLEDTPYDAQIESTVELPKRSVQSRNKGLSSQSFSHSKLVKIPESKLERSFDGKSNKDPFVNCTSWSGTVSNWKNLVHLITVDGRVSPSHVLSINMHSKKPMSYTPIDNTVVKIETPALVNTNDYKIEQVKVSMLVKDEKNNDLQEISGQINL